MNEDELCIKLTKLINSKYFGADPAILLKKVGYNKLLRYLNELILINDRDKSDLFEVIENSGSS